MGSLATHVNLVFPKGKLSQRGVMWLAEDEMLSKWWTGDQNSCPLTPTLVLTYSGSLPLKTWLCNMHMKVAGCHALFMKVHVVVLFIWTYLCMREKKISCIPWVWSCSFIERYKAPAYQCFPFLTKLSVSVVLVLIYLISGTFLPSKSPVCTFSPGVCR